MKRLKLSVRIALGILFIMAPLWGFATTYTWTGLGGSSLWNNHANWTGGATFPQSSTDDAIFDATGSNDCVISGTYTINSISVSSGYTGTITLFTGQSLSVANNASFGGGFFVGSTGTIAIGGDLQISGTDFTSSAVLAISGNFNMTGGNFRANGGTVIMKGIGSGKSITTLAGTSFYNLIITTPVTSFTFNSAFNVSNDLQLKANADLTLIVASGVTVTVGGNVFYSSSGTGSIYVNTGTLNLTGTGDKLDLSNTGSAANAGGGTGTILFTGTNQSIVGNATAKWWLLPNVTISAAGNFSLSNMITIMGNLSITSGTLAPSINSTVTLFPPANTTTTVTSSIASTFYNLIVTGRGYGGTGGCIVNFTGSPVTVSNLLTLGSTDGSGTNQTTVSLPTGSIAGISANAVLYQGLQNNYVSVLNGTIDITGYYGGSYSLSLASTCTWTPYATTDVLGTFRFVGSGYQKILRTAAAGSLTTGLSSLLPNVTINMAAGGTLDLWTSTIGLAGNWTYQSGTVNANTSAVDFYNNIGLTQTVTSAGMSFYNVGVNAPTLKLGSDLTMAANFTGGGSGSNIDPTASGYGITLGGNWSVSGEKYNPNNYAATVTFTGGFAQTVSKNISAGVDAFPFYNVVVSKTAGSVSLSTNATISHNLTLTQGNITTATPAKILTMTAGTGSISGGGIGNANSFVDGPMRWDINATGNITCPFPLGSGTHWSPISLNIPVSSATQVYYTAQMVDTSPITGYSYALSTTPRVMQKISNVRYWKIAQTTGNATGVVVTAYFNSTDQVTDPVASHLSLARSTAGAGPWADTGASTVTTYTAPITSPYTGYVTTGTLTQISTGAGDLFTLDDVGTGINPLPITVSSFKAAFDNSDEVVNVEWRTESEEEGTYFTLQRADASLSFESLTTVVPNYGDGKNGREEYSFADVHPLSGKSYYRLKQTTKDGAISYDPVVLVNSTIDKPVGVYPNPGNGKTLTITLPNDLLKEPGVMVSIRNQVGEVVAYDYVAVKGSVDLQLELQNRLPAGLYHIILGGGRTHAVKYIVKE